MKKGKTMNNADLFHNIFGLYPTELWVMKRENFWKWMNADAPAVNAMPVVRCKDCRWYYEDFYGCHRCENDGVPRESD